MGQSNALAVLVAYVLTPAQLTKVQQEAALKVYNSTNRSVYHKMKG